MLDFMTFSFLGERGWDPGAALHQSLQGLHQVVTFLDTKGIPHFISLEVREDVYPSTFFGQKSLQPFSALRLK